MPIALALTAGFIQSAISPTVLVTGMLELQRRGYGQAKGKLLCSGCTCCVTAWLGLAWLGVLHLLQCICPLQVGIIKMCKA